MEPEIVIVDRTRSRSGSLARWAGFTVAVLSLFGLAAGLFVVETLADDARASVSVSQSALEAMADTVAVVDEVASETAASLEAAAGSVDQVSATVDEAVTTLDAVAGFLEGELPETLETIQSSMPAAIQTADAVDRTLRALSLFGVSYDPDEPFGDSLSRVSEALATLPAEVREQSQALRRLVPAATNLSIETEGLSGSMTGLEESLAGFTALTADYETTLAEAEVTIADTTSSIDDSIWIMRILVVVAGLVGVVAGVALTALGGQVSALTARLDTLDLVREIEPAQT